MMLGGMMGATIEAQEVTATAKSGPGSVALTSFSATPAAKTASAASVPSAVPEQQSNALLVSGSRSETGNPLMVAGPQIGYFYPGLTLEMNLRGPGINVRGATSAPLPGYILNHPINTRAHAHNTLHI